MHPTHAAKASSSALLARPLTKNETAKPSDKTMTDLWFRMISIYGHRWSSTHGESFGDSGPSGTTWQTALAGITNTQIAHGLHGCITRDDGAWPPTLPEFRGLCLASAKASNAQPAAWVPSKPNYDNFPSPERLQWHKDNIAWVEKGGELPRPGVDEPPKPAGSKGFWTVYKGPDMRSAGEKAMSRDAMSRDWL